jgi:hypothetical protein
MNYNCWSLNLKEDYRLRVSENKGGRKKKVTGEWKDYTMRRFITATLQHTSIP